MHLATNEKAQGAVNAKGRESLANIKKSTDKAAEINHLLTEAVAALSLPTCQREADDALAEAGGAIRRLGADRREAAQLYADMIDRWLTEWKPTADAVAGAVAFYTSDVDRDELPAIQAKQITEKQPRRRREAPMQTPEALRGQAECLIGTVEEADPRHAEVVVAILTELDRRSLTVDATGALRWKASRELAAVDLGGFCRSIAFDLRRRGPVNLGTVTETAEEILHRDAQKRRQEILATMLGKPSTSEGMGELRKWVKAVTGSTKEADVQAVAHWLWLVKAKQSGRHGERHLMIVLYGPQESGKSRAAQAIIEPWAELADQKMEATTLTDERSRPALASRAIGLLDELAGLSRADANELKATITANEVGYRPMRSNDRRVLPMLMSFIGTSNRSVADLVHDSSGARRFYELQTPAHCDWTAINAIDYHLLWQAASELDQAPGLVHRDIIAKEQVRLIWRDPIQRWLEDEADAAWQSSAGLDGVMIPPVTPSAGASTAYLYQRLRAWCESAGEREPTRETMGRRLSELGWESFRLPRSQGQAPGYRHSLIGKPTPHTLHTLHTNGPDALTVQPVQGIYPKIDSAEIEESAVIL
jgi:Virulence-associated protein E